MREKAPPTWVRQRAGGAAAVLLVVGLLVAGCGTGTPHEASTSTTGATTTTSAPTPSTTAVTSTTPATSVPAGPSFTAISGTYLAGTADGGELYIRADGASRFFGPDGSACPTCSTASSPTATIDFNLKALSSTGTGAYAATGAISGISDTPWAAGFTGSPTIGSAVSLHIGASRMLTLSFLPGTDPLQFHSVAATVGNTPPCTVAAVSGPVQAGQSGATVHGVTCATDQQWAEASVSVNGIDEVTVLEAAFTQWKVVDRPTVCNHHNVPADFFQVACGTS